MIETMYAAAVSQVTESGGCSVDNLGQAPVFGFMVGVPEHSRKIDGASWIDRADAAHTFITEHVSEWRRGAYFGIWVDAATATMYLDVAERFHDRETALSAARQRGEIAIWDVVAGREIRV